MAYSRGTNLSKRSVRKNKNAIGNCEARRRKLKQMRNTLADLGKRCAASRNPRKSTACSRFNARLKKEAYLTRTMERVCYSRKRSH